MDAMVDSANARPADEKTALRRPSRREVEEAVRTLILWAGDDPGREGLLDTPRRVAAAWEELFQGYEQTSDALLGTVFEEVGGYEEMVLVKDIPFYSHCEHHIVPILGKAHVGYYPNKGVVGLSKLARVVEVYARRLQTQEHLTAQIAQAIEDGLQPRGVAVMLEAEHLCMAMRGVRKQGAATVTTDFRGSFRAKPEEQLRFLALVKGGAA